MTEILREPITGPSVWTREDLKGTAWITYLTPEEIEDLDRALRQVQARKLGCAEFGREDFDLPVFGPKIAQMRKELTDGRGFVLLRGLPVERYSLEEIETLYWGMGCHFGDVISQNADGDVLTHVTMHDHLDPAKDKIRGYQDRRHQEPHNDMADMVGLLCVRKAKQGGASSIINSPSMYNEMLATHPEYLPILYRGFPIDDRSSGAAPDAVTPNVPSFSYHNGRLCLWFSRRVIEIALRKSGQQITALEKAALDYMEELTLRDEYRVDMQLIEGDIQFVSNYTVMHSRTSFEDYEDRRLWRLMLRLWVNFPELQLDSEFTKVIRQGVSGRRRAAAS